MKTPSRDLGDLRIAYEAEATLQIPEKAKCSSTPKRFRHIIPFALLEVGFIGWIVRVGFAFDLDVSLDGCATGEQQMQSTINPSPSAIGEIKRKQWRFLSSTCRLDLI